MDNPQTLSHKDVPSSRHLISETVGLVVAYMGSSEITGDELPGFVKEVHHALLDVAVSSGAMDAQQSSPPEAGSPPEDDDISTDEHIRSMLDKLGFGGGIIDTPDPAATADTVTTSPDELYQDDEPQGSFTLVMENPPVLVEDAPKAAPTEGQPVNLKRRKTDRSPALERDETGLPRGLLSPDEALGMDYIICLEDGKKVRDLRDHLDAMGLPFEDYLAKWGLPSSYPTKAPLSILKRGPVYEYDPVTGRFREAN